MNTDPRIAKRKKWLRRLHRLGYATTVIVSLELAVIGFVGSRAWLESRRLAAAEIEGSRTKTGPWAVQPPRVFRPDEHDLLGYLPPLRELSPMGLRFVAMPSFGSSWYAFSLTSSGNGHAVGKLVVFGRVYDRKGRMQLIPRQILFKAPPAEAEGVMRSLRGVTTGWAGTSGVACLDGTPVVFELVYGDKVTSGGGNASCDPHYHAISEIASHAIRKLFPPAERPGAEWMTRTD